MTLLNSWISKVFKISSTVQSSSNRPPPYDPSLEPAPLGDVIQRGEAAHYLLNDPTLAEAIEDLRRDLLKDFLSTDPSQVERREALHRDAMAISRMVDKLIAYRATGSMKEADANLERAAARAEADEAERRG